MYVSHIYITIAFISRKIKKSTKMYPFLAS